MMMLNGEPTWACTGGSMDKNTELRCAMLYFVDEAIGFRKSVHHFHRWLETQDEYELTQLIIEVGREHFFDFWPLLNAVRNNNDEEGLIALQVAIEMGLYVPTDWTKGKVIKLSPLSVKLLESNLADMTQKLWTLNEWNNLNLEAYQTAALPVLALAYQLIIDAREDFTKFFQLVEMIIGKDSLLSCIADTDIKKLGICVGNEYYYNQRDHIKRLAVAINNNRDLNWKDALSRNQVKSKIWLVEKLTALNLIPKQRKLGDVETSTLVVGGWVGMIPFLANMLGKNLDSVTNVDIDTTVHSAALELNSGFHNNFKNSGTDVREIQLSKYKKLLLIDTIVEHFKDHGQWIASLPKGTTVVLQGNDMFDVPDHVNCHNSLEEFVASCGLNNILWAGELNLYMCNRYMAIGRV
jgi:hypothetical protein